MSLSFFSFLQQEFSLCLRIFVFFSGIVPKSIWKEAGEAGILCTTVKEQFGGPSASIIDAAVVWEEQV